MESSSENRPRVLAVDLGADVAAVDPSPWSSADALLDRVGSWSGAALGLALLLDGAEDPPFVVAVGECVRRGLPTAARATVMARGPLTGRIAEGQVGSDLGPRLARVADALSVRGRTEVPGAVLHVDADGRARVVGLPELVGADVDQSVAVIEAALGPCATLRVGPAGEAGVRFANLAAGAGPSFVGRGGLGAALGGLGLKAIAISAEPVEPAPSGSGLTRALLESPRLLARGEGGTLELAHAFAARGDLRAKGYREELSAEAGARLSAGAAAAGRERRGCTGCPTPCGWVFERGDGKRQGAHFSAVYALGVNLGLEDFDDALALLERCDRVGVDAKEAGACLALLARAGRVEWGDRAAFLALLDDLGAGRGEARAFLRGSAAFAHENGLGADAFHASGEAARPESSLASVLGQCASARGAEPMRTFPFLVGDGVTRGRIEALLAPFGVPDGAEDPGDPAGKGLLVWWHENLVTAVDTSGFCAFSAAGLLADGVCTLEELADWIAPTAVHELPGGGDAARRLLAAGASLALLHHELHRRWGVAPDEPPEWARAALAKTGMLTDYRALRGLDLAGVPTTEALERLGSTALLDLVTVDATAARPARAGQREVEPLAAGSVTIASFGPLAERLGREAEIALDLPARLIDVLRAAAAAHPRAAPWLVRDGEPGPAAYRGGARLAAQDPVLAGDRIDLVLAVSGG